MQPSDSYKLNLPSRNDLLEGWLPNGPDLKELISPVLKVEHAAFHIGPQEADLGTASHPCLNHMWTACFTPVLPSAPPAAAAPGESLRSEEVALLQRISEAYYLPAW